MEIQGLAILLGSGGALSGKMLGSVKETLNLGQELGYNLYSFAGWNQGGGERHFHSTYASPTGSANSPIVYTDTAQ